LGTVDSKTASFRGLLFEIAKYYDVFIMLGKTKINKNVIQSNTDKQERD